MADKGTGQVKRKVGNPNLHKSGKKFTSEYQPDPSRVGRKPVKLLTALLLKELESKKEIIVEGEDASGKIVKIKVKQPTKEILMGTLLRLAAKGNLKALDMILDRVEGKPKMEIGLEAELEEETKDILKYIVYSDGRKVPIGK